MPWRADKKLFGGGGGGGGVIRFRLAAAAEIGGSAGLPRTPLLLHLFGRIIWPHFYIPIFCRFQHRLLQTTTNALNVFKLAESTPARITEMRAMHVEVAWSNHQFSCEYILYIRTIASNRSICTRPFATDGWCNDIRQNR